ncbi:c-type cytochrome [Acetobacter thailandicus]|uniref:Cytochrome c n=1 Tax=Acetobacter thailandicus TaxID=1502842 RepID=A0ABT3QDU0_9PROT|nr:cytochrome c [Acetobacter thailandicus]MBS0960164.1 cytochrome c [Acetobacter thailandicus]MBS0979807.1 cytochrome c [Acetobacter thailandicus]MBS0985389.1 cytochrome c [Acetobacter thailandicus]MBS1004241.1 cytochrome c [Acetobacter thailandicus]MCX2563445.1 cytochrome c [Acetobacter thailandicus]
MIKGLKAALGTVFVGLLAGTSLAHAQSTDGELIKKGEYLARLGDCVACHTSLHGKVFAGGLAIQTPIGTIYSTNITPDAADGIGTYTEEQFADAVRRGIRKDGSTLYPAMPYPSFSNIPDDDIKAMYAYFMHGVKPVAQPNKAEDITWPLSMRWPLAVWRMMFAPTPAPFTPAPGTKPDVARGEFIVTGPGHCGACHTPRGFAMQEKAMNASGGPVYLSGGGIIDNWIAPSLRSDPVQGIGRWSEDDIVEFLKSGRTDHAAVFGAMADVVGWSSQYFTDSDLHAIASYLKSLPAVPAPQGDYKYDPSTAQALDSGNTAITAGAKTYVEQCAICHRNDGGGVPRMFPPLAGNPAVVSDNPTSVAHIVVDGGILPPTNWAPSAVAMPAYKTTLSDQQIADVVNFIRTSWGNKAPANVTASDIQKLRVTHTPIDAPTRTWGKGGVDTATWGLFYPQPYGAGWTFAPQTHTGEDDAQ